jgi:hypothetical protein
MALQAGYPVKLEAHLDPQLSRWLWLVKWLLAIPHYIVLAFLWIGVALMSIVAFFAILFTGRYPRSIFEFNVGVIRWSWRVAYYAYGALGTDRYPPFTLADVPDYPTRLEISYPERLSRGLVLIKGWLLALPHLVIVGVLMGGTWVAWQADDVKYTSPGLIGLLVFFAGVALAVSGRYPSGLYDLILGLNRWVLRVAAYVLLMTDAYPPFRLDMGGDEWAGTLTVPPGGPAGGASATTTAPTGVVKGWGTGSIVAMIAGGLAGLLSLGFLAGGGVLLWADQTQRDATGFLSTPVETLDTDTYAIVTEGVDLRFDEGPDWLYPSRILGETRLSISAQDDSAVFVGIGRSSDVSAYLSGVGHATVKDLRDDALVTTEGGAPSPPASKAGIWTAYVEGTGVQDLQWTPRSGEWTVVVMNADVSQGVTVRGDVGAEMPALPWIYGGLLAVGGVLLLAAVVLLGGAIYSSSRTR